MSKGKPFKKKGQNLTNFAALIFLISVNILCHHIVKDRFNFTEVLTLHVAGSFAFIFLYTLHLLAISHYTSIIEEIRYLSVKIGNNQKENEPFYGQFKKKRNQIWKKIFSIQSLSLFIILCSSFALINHYKEPKPHFLKKLHRSNENQSLEGVNGSEANNNFNKEISTPPSNTIKSEEDNPGSNQSTASGSTLLKNKVSDIIKDLKKLKQDTKDWAKDAQDRPTTKDSVRDQLLITQQLLENNYENFVTSLENLKNDLKFTRRADLLEWIEKILNHSETKTYILSIYDHIETYKGNDAVSCLDKALTDLTNALILLGGDIEDDGETHFNLGLKFLDENEELKDEELGINLIKKASEKSYLLADLYLGHWHEIINDQFEALGYYQRAAAKGNPEAHFKAGLISQKTGDYPSAIKHYKSAIEDGITAAANNLGFIWDQGLGINEDDTKAVALYSSAAENGNPEAQFNLAYMYFNALGVSYNWQKAVEWMEKAVGQDYADAQYYLALKQPYRAEELLQKAALKGHMFSQYSLAQLYSELTTENDYYLFRLTEIGLQKSNQISIAIEWFRKAAMQGHWKAQLVMSKYYKKEIKDRFYTAIGFDNPQESSKWKKRADSSEITFKEAEKNLLKPRLTDIEIK